VAEILRQLAAAMVPDGNNALRLRFARSLLKTVKPGDQMQMLQVTQIIVIHLATMNVAELMHTSRTPKHINCYGNIFNKLARTSAAQIETLQRLRPGIEQNFTVSVNEGGRAIVGITHNSGSSGTIESAKPPLSLSDQSGTKMRIIKPDDHLATMPRLEQHQEPAPGTTRRRRRA
jgi:hypothetical protein